MMENAWTPIELDDEYTKELGRLTATQLRFLVCRLAFPEHQISTCAETAGYAHPSERGSEQERKPLVKELLARCERHVRDADGEPMKSMEREDLIAFHEGVIRDPRTTTREKQASSQQLAELRKWIKSGNSVQDKAHDFQQILQDAENTKKLLAKEPASMTA